MPQNKDQPETEKSTPALWRRLEVLKAKRERITKEIDAEIEEISAKLYAVLPPKSSCILSILEIYARLCNK